MRRYQRKMVCVLCLCVWCLTACALGGGQDSEEQKEKIESAEIFAMNTVMNLTIYGEHADEMMAEAKKRIYQYENLFSVNADKSDTAKLNRAGGKLIQVSEETYDLMKKSLEISKQTDGLFDISVYPLVRAWGFTTEQYRIPNKKERSQLSKLIRYEKIKLGADHTVKMPVDMQVDFGGIAKGYVSQKLIDLFREGGASAAVISLGGNVQTFGTKPDGSPFTVGITDPSDGSSVYGTIEIGETAVVTSGSYQRYFEKDGTIYHHIIDKRTGAPAKSDLTSVTVLCQDGASADGLATALFLMGKKKAIAFDKKNKEIQCILIDQENQVWVSDGLTFNKNES